MILAKWVGLQMMRAGIRLTSHANVKTTPDKGLAATLKVVYEAAGETVIDLYRDVARVIKALKGLQGLLPPL